MQTPAGWSCREQGSQGAENSHTAKKDLLHISQQWASVARVAHHVLSKNVVSQVEWLFPFVWHLWCHVCVQFGAPDTMTIDRLDRVQQSDQEGLEAGARVGGVAAGPEFA